MTANTAMWLNNRKQCQDSHIVPSGLPVLLLGCFKKADIQFKCNNMLPNDDEEY